MPLLEFLIKRRKTQSDLPFSLRCGIKSAFSHLLWNSPKAKEKVIEEGAALPLLGVIYACLKNIGRQS